MKTRAVTRRAAWLISVFGLLAACAALEPAGGRSMSKEECRAASVCSLAGDLALSSSGHAWIGRLTLDSGECVNVSLPDEVTRTLVESGANGVRLVGDVVHYPEFERNYVVVSFAVRGREVGIGDCGDFLVFVERPRNYSVPGIP